MIGYSYTEANYTYGIDYVADQLREYDPLHRRRSAGPSGNPTWTGVNSG